jgi:hypothetical protein
MCNASRHSFSLVHSRPQILRAIPEMDAINALVSLCNSCVQSALSEHGALALACTVAVSAV